MKSFEGFLKRKFGDNYTLLAGGGTKSLTDFAMASDYLPLLGGGTVTGNITLSGDLYANGVQVANNTIVTARSFGFLDTHFFYQYDDTNTDDIQYFSFIHNNGLIGTGNGLATILDISDQSCPLFVNSDIYVCDPTQSSFSGHNLYIGGDVGIGTTSPSYELDVDGSANATILYENGNRVITTANISSQSVSYASSADTLDGYHAYDFLRYEGWWNEGSGQNVNDAEGMTFVYSDHGSPSGWGILSTFSYENGSSYKMQLFSNGYNDGYTYYRNKSSDRGGWGNWIRLLDSTNWSSIVDGRYVLRAGHSMSGNLTFSSYVGMIQNQPDTSNYTCAIEWLRNGTGWYKSDGTTLYTNQPQIGQHNTGDSYGAITILPYATDTDPWSSSVGLYISKNLLKYEGNKVWHESNDGSGSGLDADLLDGLHESSFVKFYLSPMTSGAPADSAKSWFINTMPSESGAIVYNFPGSEKTIIAGKSSGAFGHMLQLNYDDTYLRILRYYGGSWKSTDWEKISAGYADNAESATYASILSMIDTTAEDNCVPGNAQASIYYGSPVSAVTGNAFILSMSVGSYTTQLAIDVDPTYRLAIRHRYQENWYSWVNIITSDNIADYAVRRLAWWNDTDSHNVDDLTSGVTFAYTNHNAPTTGTIVALTSYGSTNYSLQLQGQYNGENLYFRNRNGDNNTLNTWRYVIHDGNISNQYVYGCAQMEYLDSLYPTVGDVKNRLNVIWGNDNYQGGVGANVSIGSSFIHNWDNDASTYYPSSSFSMIKIGGSYYSTRYGQWLLSSYSLTNIGIVGKDDGTWTTIKWIPFADGTGATGTWGISITGNADTATDATNATNLTGNPSLQAGTSNANAITVTAGNKTSAEFVVPYSTKTIKLISSGTIDTTTVDSFCEASVFKMAYISNTDANTLFSGSDGFLFSVGVSGGYGHQIHIDDTQYNIWHRNTKGPNLNWDSWVKILDTSNVSPSLDISGNTIAITIGGITSSYITVPYATNAGSAQILGCNVAQGSTSLADGDVLVYDSGAWYNVARSTYLSGYATTSQLGNYLPLSGGTLIGTINLSNLNGKITFGSLTTSPITGYNAPSLGSNGIGIYSRYGGGGDEGAIIVTEDTCVIYNSADTGWNFQVMDKDLGTDMTSDATRSFGINDSHQAFSLGGFVKSGSDNSYVLLGGGGHKLESSLSVNYANYAGYANTIVMTSTSFSGDGRHKIFFTTTAPSNGGTSYVGYNNNFYVSSSGVYYSSDRNLKTNICKYLPYALLIENPVRYFNWKDNTEKLNIGFIAQEIEEWCPEAVDTSESGSKTVNYKTALTALCSIMYDRIQKLEMEVERLNLLVSN